MNTQEYISLLNRPSAITPIQAAELENLLAEFPFLQNARALYLKALYNQDSYRYNNELKKTAAYTTDRSVLFEFITSENFRSLQKDYFDREQLAIQEISITTVEEIKTITAPPEKDKLEESIIRTIKGAENAEKNNVKTEETAKANLSIGTPIPFQKNEKHSFSEWLQLSSIKHINREQEENKKPAGGLDTKLEIIDRFIESNPKITPVKSTATPASVDINSSDNSSLMTETLAKVYLEQKKYTKAIQAYEILILKYPEKSVFFADRISDIKILQQNNN